MIDERYSHSRFLALGSNTEASDDLARELEEQIQRDASEDLRVLGENIAVRLRALGHNLGDPEVDLLDGAGIAWRFVDASRGSTRESTNSASTSTW